MTYRQRLALALRLLANQLDPVPKSEIVSCYIEKRATDGVLMDFREGGIAIVTLRGYTIAPTEVVGTPPFGTPVRDDHSPIILANARRTL